MPLTTGRECGGDARRALQSSIFLSSLCFMSRCNPLGYDKPEGLYIHNLAWLDTPYLSSSALPCRKRERRAMTEKKDKATPNEEE